MDIPDLMALLNIATNRCFNYAVYALQVIGLGMKFGVISYFKNRIFFCVFLENFAFNLRIIVEHDNLGYTVHEKHLLV